MIPGGVNDREHLFELGDPERKLSGGENECKRLFEPGDPEHILPVRRKAWGIIFFTTLSNSFAPP